MVPVNLRPSLRISPPRPIPNCLRLDRVTFVHSCFECNMLIVCWNVAGLSTTVHRIHSTYGDRKRKTTFLSDYMKRHEADIFCIQEHKIPLSQLSTRSEPLGCANVEGYESFWACCVDPKKKGFNGVVTYVKKGMVVTANSRPLGSADLDDQGRCVMTDHGSFVLFNVYVPANSGQPLSYKMKFLNALRCAMQNQRTKHNKKVILVGDLNISHRPKDKYWGDRVLFVNDIRQEVSACNEPSSLPRWKLQLAAAWQQIEAALATKAVVSTKTTNSLTHQKYDKYRMTIQVNGKSVFLGSHESHPGYCEHCYDFSEWQYVCADSEERILAEEENVVSISIVAELLQKIAGIEWDEALQRDIASKGGGTSRVAPPRRWLNSILEEDGMVDAFEYFYPGAEGRYTCWNQFTNKRYTNEGARIDFALVDSALVPMIQKGSVKALRCGCRLDALAKHDPDSEAAALCAATANGGFRAVSFEGGGIVEATQATLDTQFGVMHTGMIYTPPSFSDHTAISLLLDDKCCKGTPLVFEEQDPLTRKAQPHKSQKTISAFFSSSPAAVPSSLVTRRSCDSNMATKRKNDIKGFLVTKGQQIEEEDAAKRPRVSPTTNISASMKSSATTKGKAPVKGTILHHFMPKK